MASDWSEGIVVAELADEPALSDELAELAERLRARSGDDVPHVVLNFSDVTYVNSSNIAQLLRLREMLSEAGQSLRLCSVGDEVWSVFLVAGLDKVFQFSPDTLTALAGLQLEDAGTGSE